MERSAPELVVLDRRLPDGDGLDYLPELKAQLSRDELAALGDRVVALQQQSRSRSRARATSS